jgi:hypothetical protein
VAAGPDGTAGRATGRGLDPLSGARLARSALWTLAATAVAAAVLLAVFREPGGRRAVLTSAAVALVVQALSFLAARAAAPGRVLAVWVGGAAARMVTLVLYALVALRPLGLPAAPALLSLATFFFVTTLAESRLHLR